MTSRRMRTDFAGIVREAKTALRSRGRHPRSLDLPGTCAKGTSRYAQVPGKSDDQRALRAADRGPGKRGWVSGGRW
ncbi:hypothetical protein GCM10028775_76260 [Catellatospora paridis]